MELVKTIFMIIIIMIMSLNEFYWRKNKECVFHFSCRPRSAFLFI